MLGASLLRRLISRAVESNSFNGLNTLAPPSPLPWALRPRRRRSLVGDQLRLRQPHARAWQHPLGGAGVGLLLLRHLVERRREDGLPALERHHADAVVVADHDVAGL